MQNGKEVEVDRMNTQKKGKEETEKGGVGSGLSKTSGRDTQEPCVQEKWMEHRETNTGRGDSNWRLKISLKQKKRERCVSTINWANLPRFCRKKKIVDKGGKSVENQVK